MDLSKRQQPPFLPPDPQFATTHWSLVLAAGDPEDSASQQALAELCQAYWYPIYAYVRHRVSDTDQAQDLTQEFFARLLEKHSLAAADSQSRTVPSFSAHHL